jgi:RNA polymerase sigma factor (TIGR02999 family)
VVCEAGADLDRLLPGAYDELRRIARHHLRRHAEVGTLSTTAVVHEAYLKLADGRGRWEHREHFLALASRAMRQLLVDHARRRHAEKRGGHGVHVTLSQAEAQDAPVLDVVELDSALEALARIDPVLERVVECRFFAGLDVAETAAVLGRSPRSVERDWARARAYLFQWLSPK